MKLLYCVLGRCCFPTSLQNSFLAFCHRRDGSLRSTGGMNLPKDTLFNTLLRNLP